MKVSYKGIAHTIGYIATVFITVAAFQNCADSLPADLNSTQQSSEGTGDGVIIPLQVTAPANIATGATSLLSASGGTAPYIFRIVSGPATIVNGNTFQAGTTAGLVTLEVTDADGSVTQQSVQVGTAVVLQACTTPWGDPVAAGESVNAYKDATGSCSSACQVQTRICDGATGMLSGTFTKKACTSNCTKWVNVTNAKESHEAACARRSLVPATPTATLNYGICASAESAPKSGTDYGSINYQYGSANTKNVGGTVLTKIEDIYYCYKASQKQDHDNSDKVVAYLCK